MDKLILLDDSQNLADFISTVVDITVDITNYKINVISDIDLRTFMEFRIDDESIHCAQATLFEALKYECDGSDMLKVAHRNCIFARLQKYTANSASLSAYDAYFLFSALHEIGHFNDWKKNANDFKYRASIQKTKKDCLKSNLSRGSMTDKKCRTFAEQYRRLPLEEVADSFASTHFLPCVKHLEKIRFDGPGDGCL